MLCNELLVAVWVVGHVAIFSQQQCQRLRADVSMSVSKQRLVKQSTLAIALSVPHHRYGYICTAVYFTLVVWYLMILSTLHDRHRKNAQFWNKVPVLMLPSLRYLEPSEDDEIQT